METRSNHILVGAVTLSLLIALLGFTVWIAGLSAATKICYDVYFAEGVGGLNRGSNVSFSGVPVGEVESISLLPDNPEFVWVRISVDSDTPVLQGTQAQISGVGFTGVSEIQLDGAIEGAKPLTDVGPQGCPVIPASASVLDTVLNSAPELIDRIQRLTERMTELLSDENQNSISDILENIERTTDTLAARAPDLADAVADARVAARQAGIAAERWGQVADSTDRILNENAGPAMEDLQSAIKSIEGAAANLDGAINDARPGLQTFSKSTLPEADRLVRDLRQLTDSLDDFTRRLNEEGVGGALKPQKLPDYKPR
ncbi:MlaD family protein [Sphingomicrobium lutaoense]|uniref:Phospholipid/cholesterol/gamma-HCH transport system substrate-binding protein n=1 Tax=Sphingomicrobium lutaoense TaxID=515949 RepID=A0A839YWE6_9SPHN|nr:MlaD family protein [Sphingomicrobium lutaoense]MBB3764531.1 phospholipid/cholesterol/gamma-HCH transport system substrate-binding protein [Sphingomicrobium lutaoense]